MPRLPAEIIQIKRGPQVQIEVNGIVCVIPRYVADRELVSKFGRDGPNEEYRAACLLAEACGVDLEDG